MDDLANSDALWLGVYYKVTVVACCKPGHLPRLSALFPNAVFLIANSFNKILHTSRLRPLMASSGRPSLKSVIFHAI